MAFASVYRRVRVRTKGRVSRDSAASARCTKRVPTSSGPRLRGGLTMCYKAARTEASRGRTTACAVHRTTRTASSSIITLCSRPPPPSPLFVTSRRLPDFRFPLEKIRKKKINKKRIEYTESSDDDEKDC